MSSGGGSTTLHAALLLGRAGGQYRSLTVGHGIIIQFLQILSLTRGHKSDLSIFAWILVYLQNFLMDIQSMICLISNTFRNIVAFLTLVL